MLIFKPAGRESENVFSDMLYTTNDKYKFRYWGNRMNFVASQTYNRNSKKGMYQSICARVFKQMSSYTIWISYLKNESTEPHSILLSRFSHLGIRIYAQTLV